MTNKTSRNLYWILVLLLFYFLFSISDFDYEGFKNFDGWLFVFLVTLNISSQIVITRISFIRAENSPDYFAYKLRIHRLFDKHKNNLGSVKKRWLAIISRDYAQEGINQLYFLAYQMKILDFDVSIEDVYYNILEGTYPEFLKEKGIMVNKINKRKINKQIKVIEYNYKIFEKYKVKFDYAERDYRNGSLVKSFDLDVGKEIRKLFVFLFTTIISIYGFIHWDKTIIFKLIVTALFVGINIIISFVETKEYIEFYKDYWEDIEKALLEEETIYK